MGKKLKRVFRDVRLTPEEVAADNELRRKVENEFPPKRATERIRADSMSELLRRSIRESGRRLEEVAADAGISPIVVSRFLSGEGDIHMTTADRLATALGLEVTSE